MCGIFGAVSLNKINTNNLRALADHASQRGRDSSGILWQEGRECKIVRADFSISKLFNYLQLPETKVLIGHSRLVTHGIHDNQPIYRDGVIAIHNGIVLNAPEIWERFNLKPKLEIDSEILPALAAHFLLNQEKLEGISQKILQECEGSISCVLIFPKLSKVMLFSNTGSLYLGEKDRTTFFASEKFALQKINALDIRKVTSEVILDTSQIGPFISQVNHTKKRLNLVPSLKNVMSDAKILEYKELALKRCTRCILPETMPFIYFDALGVCNYCRSYTKRNQANSLDQLELILEKYRSTSSNDCIVPFSGGRDSTYALYLAVKRFNMKPIAFTYDWGMVTDIGRRNISQICAKLKIENITVAADIGLKRRNIRKNLIAWLANPNLGMISMLTAGDKHFFKYIETIKKQTQINLDLWGINPLEVTHFKSGFLGLPPSIQNHKVYNSGLANQIKYQKLRLKEMIKSPRYFNLSLFDTISGEYYRSRSKPNGYIQIFDYIQWDESEINAVLDEYGWERAIDSHSTWRIGDGTAAFYNYVYHRVAGFTEHDTFRSNQIREGSIERSEALRLVQLENLPRQENIRWYIDAVGLNYENVIARINDIPRLGYSKGYL